VPIDLSQACFDQVERRDESPSDGGGCVGDGSGQIHAMLVLPHLRFRENSRRGRDLQKTIRPVTMAVRFWGTGG
jgi:hypothetical protein